MEGLIVVGEDCSGRAQFAAPQNGVRLDGVHQHIEDSSLWGGGEAMAGDNEAAWIEAGTAQRVQPQPFLAPDGGAAASNKSRFVLDWVDSHRETAIPADPNYPNGCAIDVALNAPRTCRVQLPYPAARCGTWIITCRVCLYAIALETAGRADDPASVRVPCKAA